MFGKKAKNDDKSDEELCISNSESDDEWSCSYCNKGFVIIGSISFGTAFVAGKKRVP
mgnify:CR=1 FL=1